MKKIITLIALVSLIGCTRHTSQPVAPEVCNGQEIRSAPQYPAKARALQIEGSVSVSYTVNVEGRAENIKIVTAQPSDLFDHEVKRAVSKWACMTPTKTPVVSFIAFRLKGGAVVAPVTRSLPSIQTANKYAEKLRSAIQAKLYDGEQYHGKSCALRLSLERSGQVQSAKVEGGDPALCQAVLSAVKAAEMPTPPSDEIYEQFKNVPIDVIR